MTMEQPYQSPQASLPVADIGRLVCAAEDPAKDRYKLTAYNGEREHRSTFYVHHSEDQDRAGFFKDIVDILVHDLPYAVYQVVAACADAQKEVAAHVAKPVEFKTHEGKTIRISA